MTKHTMPGLLAHRMRGESPGAGRVPDESPGAGRPGAGLT
jgi:hypothetical protein